MYKEPNWVWTEEEWDEFCNIDWSDLYWEDVYGND